MTKYVNNNGVSEMWLNIKNWVTSQLLGYSQTGHTHSASDITSGLSTVATSGSYSDLSNKPTIPSNTNQLTNGAGYITSSSNITGTAAAATKLATARSISAGDLEFQGSANFDGSDNIKLNITQHRSLVTIGNTNNYPFHRIAYTAQETGNYTDRAITFFIGKEYVSGGYGICRIVLRTNNASSSATAQCEVQWLVRTSGIPVDAIQVGFNNTAAASYVDVFYKSSGAYHSVICRVISHANSRISVGQGFTVVSTSSEASNTTTSNPLTSTESYATIAAAGTKIRGKAYTSTITASDAGIVNFATYNANGKELVNSIIKGLSVSGRTITYTKLDGSTGTLTTQDTNTTYSNFVKSGSGAAAGLVPAPSTTAGTTKYLREDGTWQVPPDHTYTVNNATLTIQKNGSNVATFTSNASSNVTANITVPTNTNQLTNGAGFITSSGSCNYANSAGSVAWGNITGKPSFSSNPVQIGYTTQKTGTWTLTGVVPYKPVIFYFSIWNYPGSIALPNNNAAWVVGAKQTSTSSSDYNDATKLWKFISGDYNKSIVKASALIIPLSSTVSISINVSGSNGVNLYAYQ